MAISNVQSGNEWAELSEPQFPILKTDQENGSIFEVIKVGFYMATLDECEKLGVDAKKIPGEKYALPTASVKFGNVFELCKLPIELTDWVLDAVYMALNGTNVFPASVELGELNGRKYAEIL